MSFGVLIEQSSNFSHFQSYLAMRYGYEMPHLVRLVMHVLLFFHFFFPLALSGLDGSEPTGASKEVSVAEAGKRPVGRRRKGPPISGRGVFALPFFYPNHYNFMM